MIRAVYMLTRAQANRLENPENPSTDSDNLNESCVNEQSLAQIGPEILTPSVSMEEQIRVERERLSRQRAEWEELRLRMVEELRGAREARDLQERELRLIRQENEQLRNNSITSESNDRNAGMLNGLVNGIQSMNITIKPPRFGNDYTANPSEFLEQVQKYFLVKKVQDDCQLFVLETLLDGRARDWYRAQTDAYVDFDAFKVAFLEEFYSVPTVVRLKTQWSSRRYTSAESSMQSYFFKQSSAAQYFIPKLEQYEINYSVVQQLPMRARDALVTIDYGNTNAVARALAQLDASFEESKSRDVRRNPPNSQSNLVAPPNNPGSSGGSRFPNSSANAMVNNRPNSVPLPAAYRARRIDCEEAPWYPWPDMSIPPPLMTMVDPSPSHLDQRREECDTPADGQRAHSSLKLGCGAVSRGSRRHRYPFDLFEDLTSSITKRDNDPSSKDSKSSDSTCPHAILFLFNIPVSALFDTGSQITCMSEQFYIYLKKLNKLLELPVANVVVLTAVKERPTPVRKQVMLEVVVGGRRVSTVFLVIPHLSSHLIIGSDWMSHMGLVIDFSCQSMTINGEVITPELVSFGRAPPERLNVSESNDFTYIQILRITDGMIPLHLKHPGPSQRLTPAPVAPGGRNRSNDQDVDPNSMADGAAIGGELSPTVVDAHSADEPLATRGMTRESKDGELNESIAHPRSGDESHALAGSVAAIPKKLEHHKSGPVGLWSGRIESDCGMVMSGVVLPGRAVEHGEGDGFVEAFVDRNEYPLDHDDASDPALSEERSSCRLYQEGEDENFFEDVNNIVSDLADYSSEQREAFKQTLSKYARLFAYKAVGAGTYEHRIRLRDSKAIMRRSYPVPFAMRERVGAEMVEMLAAGIIERSDSQYCNPLRIVEKKDGRIRICLDARFLNNIIESDNESPPIIGEILQKYHGTQCISLTDLAYGYWQIPLAVESRPYTAFLYGSQLYHFCRIPFGLKTAGSGFIRALNLALGNEFDSFLTCYIDDLLITSASFDDHLHYLDLVFHKLQTENFTLRLDKSYFFRREVKFLGFILSVEGIRPNPSKLEKIRQFAEPKNRKELQQIIGVCTYYRQFTVCHSKLIDPFRNLLKSKGTWSWTPTHSQAFVALKNAFADSITLRHVMQNAPFRLQTDGSDRGISGILYQIDSEGYHRIVSLVSRCLNAAEINYNTTEKELLAIVY